MKLFHRLIVLGLPMVPKLIVGKVAKRYVAGETLNDAVRTIQVLNAQGAMATLDVLGEEVKEEAKADQAVAEYMRAFDAIDGEGLDCNISIKPTLLGLKISEEVCLAKVRQVLERAVQSGSFVRIDMEDHTCTDATLRMYEQLEQELGHTGTVLQAYLRRTVADIERLLELEGGPNIRLCKGIYVEPREIAWKDFDTVRANFVYGLEKLMRGGAYVGVATHDEHLVWAAMMLIDRLGLSRDQYEFQMLLGVDEGLRKIILDHGHRLRVYVPYGVDWYPYSIRRLRENPKIATYVMRAMLTGR
jgi:proline dehydrogenase